MTWRHLPAALLVLATALAVAAPQQVSPSYVGSQNCTGCHSAQNVAWQGSHHAKAMQPVNPKTVLGDFGGARFANAGVSWRFHTRAGKYMARLDRHRGKPVDYQVRHTFGVYPLQQYLVELPGGRLQALSVAWDARPKAQGGQRWYSLYPEQEPIAGDPLHWSGRDLNWNFMCAACHSTGVKKNFDLARNSYSTTRSEDGVGCEACHGPGSRHVDWAGGRAGELQPGDKGLVKMTGATVDWKLDPGHKIASPTGDVDATRKSMDICVPCHARRQEITTEQNPAAQFMDNYSPSLLERGLYHADGQIDGEVFEYGSFAQSRMYRSGVTCNNCHDAHTGKLKAGGNALCLQCHSAASYGGSGHHHHSPDSAGALCVNCHMPQKTYMGIHERRDHSLRIPRPDLTVKHGSPNACNQCHSEKSAQWAADVILAWTGQSPDARANEHAAAATTAAWSNSPATPLLLTKLVADAQVSPISRATAMAHLSRPATATATSVVESSARHADPLIRLGAARSLPALAPPDALRIGLTLVADKTRSVRIEAARALAGAPDDGFSTAQRQSLQSALAELIYSEQANADRPESHVNLAQIYLRLGRSREAERELASALRLDGKFTPAMVNLADLYRGMQRDDKAETWLRRAIKSAPLAAEPVHALGLLEIRRGRREAALSLLRQANLLAPGNAHYAYVYALVLQEGGDLQGALAVVERGLSPASTDAPLLRLRIALERRLHRSEAARAHEAEYARLAGEGEIPR